VTPAARISAAIELLDQISDGAPAEQALTHWGRANRYAGSKDRAAIRDHVYAALRRKRSASAIGGGSSGRALMLGLLVQDGIDPHSLFTGDRFAPPPLSAEEEVQIAASPSLTQAQALDLPDWLFEPAAAPFGADADQELSRLRERAAMHLRVNLARTDRATAQARLRDDGIETYPHPLCDTALEAEGHPRGLKVTQSFAEGWVELQDAASQAAVAMVPCQPGDRVLDYCAGGGGKALALAARCRAKIEAHDALPARMRDIPERAARAGAAIRVLAGAGDIASDGYETVICDVPCSGSGTWRRDPAAKWTLSPARLDQLTALQARILIQAAHHVRPGGHLVYMTCSLFEAENEAQLDRFLETHRNFSCSESRRFRPSEGGDGFFCAIMARNTA